MDNTKSIAILIIGSMAVGFIGTILYFNGAITRMQDTIDKQQRQIDEIIRTSDELMRKIENNTLDMFDFLRLEIEALRGNQSFFPNLP